MSLENLPLRQKPSNQENRFRELTAETETKQPGHWVERDIPVTSSVCAERVQVAVSVLSNQQ